MKRFGSLLFVGVSAGVVVAQGCGDAFSVGSGGAGGSGGARPSSTSSTSASGSASSTTTRDAAAPPCTVGDPNACKVPGMYCDGAATPTCRSCTNLSHFEFSVPTQMPVTAGTVPSGATMTTPRLTPSLDLYFTFIDAYNRRRIGSGEYVPIPRTWGPLKQSPQPLNPPIIAGYDISSANPLYLADSTVLTGLLSPPLDGVGGLGAPVILFDMTGGSTGTTQQIYATNPDDPDAGRTTLVLPLAAGRLDSSIAVSPNAPVARLWWVRDDKLMTTARDAADAGLSDPTEVPLLLATKCTAKGVGSPWATPDGEHLLFHAATLTDACDAISSGSPSTLYITAIDSATGLQPSGVTAQPVFPNDPSNSNVDASPSLSADMCYLVFAHNGKLMFASRK